MTTRRVDRALALGLVLTVINVLIFVIGLANHARAETSADYTTDLKVTKLQATKTGGLTSILALPSRYMYAGDRLLVTARLAGKSNAVRYPRMAIRLDATGAATVRSPVKAINHRGKSYGTESVTVRWLFVAPVNGTYTITARAEATTYLAPVSSTYLTLVPTTTYLKAAYAGYESVTWAPGDDTCVGAKAHPDPDVAACGTKRTSVTVARKYVPIKAGVTTATFTTDLELSREYGSYPGGNGKVRVKFQVTPKNSDGTTCRSTSTVSRDLSITSTRHHWHELKTLSNLNVSGCAKAYVRTTVTHLGGNPVAIHDERQSNSIALMDITTAYKWFTTNTICVEDQTDNGHGVMAGAIKDQVSWYSEHTNLVMSYATDCSGAANTIHVRMSDDIGKYAGLTGSFSGSTIRNDRNLYSEATVKLSTQVDWMDSAGWTHVVGHEIGHALGMRHSELDSIMATDGSYRLHPSTYDVRDITWLYPSGAAGSLSR